MAVLVQRVPAAAPAFICSRRLSKTSRKESSLSDKKIRKPVSLVTAENPNDYTIPSTDISFPDKYLSVSPYKFRGRKPSSIRISNPEKTTDASEEPSDDAKLD